MRRTRWWTMLALMVGCSPWLSGSVPIYWEKGEERRELNGSDGRQVTVGSSAQAMAVGEAGQWLMAGTIREEWKHFNWQLDQVNRRVPPGDQEADVERPIEVRAYLRHGYSMGTSGRMDFGNLLAGWPAIGTAPAAAVFVWIVGDQVARIEVRALAPAEDYLEFTVEARARFSAKDAARCRVGVGIVVGGRWIEPTGISLGVGGAEALEAALFDDPVAWGRAQSTGFDPRVDPEAENSMVRTIVQMGASTVLTELLAEYPDLAAVTTARAETLLHLAAYFARTECAAVLLRAGAPLDARMPNTFPALSVSASYGHREMTAALLAAGARRTYESDGVPMNAVDAAIGGGDVGTAEMLVAAGAPFPRDLRTARLLADAAGAGNLPMVKWLVQSAPYNAVMKGASLALADAVVAGRSPALVEVLTKAGASTSGEIDGNEPPLMTAARMNRADLVSALLDAGARVDLRDVDGNSALHHAAAWNAGAAARELLTRGANSGLKNRQGATPLDIALRGCADKVASALVESGARLDSQAVGFSDLLVAAIRLDLDALVARALEGGWDGNQLILGKWNAAGVASLVRAPRVTQLLADRGVERKGPELVDARNLDRAPQLAKSSPLPDPRPSGQRRTPLRVQVRLVVGTEGRVLLPVPVGETASLNLGPVLKEIGDWRFAPPLAGKKPVPTQLVVPVVIKPATTTIPTVSAVDEAPRLVHRVPVKVPTKPPAPGNVTHCVLRVTVDASGAVSDVSAILNQHKEFSQAAIAAVRQWRFEPAKQNGQATAVLLEIPFTWNN